MEEVAVVEGVDGGGLRVANGLVLVDDGRLVLLNVEVDEVVDFAANVVFCDDGEGSVDFVDFGVE